MISKKEAEKIVALHTILEQIERSRIVNGFLLPSLHIPLSLDKVILAIEDAVRIELGLEQAKTIPEDKELPCNDLLHSPDFSEFNESDYLTDSPLKSVASGLMQVQIINERKHKDLPLSEVGKRLKMSSKEVVNLGKRHYFFASSSVNGVIGTKGAQDEGFVTNQPKAGENCWVTHAGLTELRRLKKKEEDEKKR